MQSEIIIQEGLLQSSSWIQRVKTLSMRCILITDDHVQEVIAKQLQDRLEAQGCLVCLFSVPAGERSKTRQMKASLEDRMLDAKCGRDSVLLAVGGGVVTDLAGFVAATYCRGIPWVCIPTTLLGQVDAGIGGKVGVNTPHGKNMIGAYYPPRLVFIDPTILYSLPQREHLNGMAEVIKYALITSPSLFQQLEEGLCWEKCIGECAAIKQEIVEKDPHERGLRRILNFGHTVGHAIETAYQISHGAAVAIGLFVESELSYRLGYLKKEAVLQIHRLLKQFGFSLQLPPSLDPHLLVELMQLDKKALHSQPRFVLLQAIGTVHPFEGAYCAPVDQHIVEGVLQEQRFPPANLTERDIKMFS
jgi:3-dehydroquinate synthase